LFLEPFGEGLSTCFGTLFNGFALEEFVWGWRWGWGCGVGRHVFNLLIKIICDLKFKNLMKAFMIIRAIAIF